MNPRIIVCDSQILVVEKPSGWLTQTEGGEGRNVEAFCKQWVKRRYQKPGNVFLHAVHRLDRPASGLVLFARTSKALSRLNEAMRAQAIERVYIAEVEGHLEEQQGRLEHCLDHGVLSLQGQRASLTFVTSDFTETTSWVRVFLETGRYHQIRAQFAAIGHPIVGDVRYGSSMLRQEGIQLFCEELSFVHPVTREKVRFQRSDTQDEQDIECCGRGYSGD